MPFEPEPLLFDSCLRMLFLVSRLASPKSAGTFASRSSPLMLCTVLWLGDLAKKAPHANKIDLDVKFASTSADAETALDKKTRHSTHTLLESMGYISRKTKQPMDDDDGDEHEHGYMEANARYEDPSDYSVHHCLKSRFHPSSLF